MTKGTLSTGTTGWVKSNKTIVYNVIYALGTGNTRVTATVGACTSGCSNAGSLAGSGTVTFAPATSLTDPAGNAATGTKIVALVLF